MANNSDLSGRFAMVTGAAGGIGLEFAKTLAGQGASIILVDISRDRLLSAKGLLEKDCRRVESQQFLTLQLDLTEENFIDKIEGFCRENSVLPDILINNAGIFSFSPMTETSPKKVETFIDLHVRAVSLLSQWFVGKRTVLKSGWMLNMSSMSCWMPMPGLALYSSTKSYIRVFTRALHYEVRDYNVGVTVACPGGIATDLFGLPEKWKRFAVAIGVLDTPERFAKKAVKRMLKKKKQYINGALNRFSIFFIGILPTSLRMLVKHKLLDKGIKR
ncbi:MAG: SDR family NAD(P)-dependent oxidoreductase [Muribaculaceae bacterium]|nr:SDR family NAD(P)-dependent oxidoreductase [Muribaculaceae bacterium]